VNFQKYESLIINLKTKPTISFVSGDLCKFVVDPIVTGSKLDFWFVISLTANKTALDAYSKTLNELTLYFPSKYFGAWANSNNIDQICTYMNVRVPCFFTNNFELTIRFPTPLSSGAIAFVYLLNIPFGAWDSRDIIFCSVNNYDINGQSLSLINGYGKLISATDATTNIAGVVQNTAVKNTFNLRYFTNGFSTSSSDIRSRVTITLRVGVDFIYKQSKDIIVDNTPIFHIYFPDEFKLNLYQFYTGDTLAIPNVTITEYTFDNVNKQLNIGKVTLSGNRVTAPLNDSSLTISTNHNIGRLSLKM